MQELASDSSSWRLSLILALLGILILIGGVIAGVWFYRIGAWTAPEFIQDPQLTFPHERAPLAALVEFTTDEPVRARLVLLDGGEERQIVQTDQWALSHRLPVIGLRAGTPYALEVSVEDESGHIVRFASAISFTTPSLPADFPSLATLVSQPAEMEPGVTLFSVYKWQVNEIDETYGLIVALDERGEVIWYYRADHEIGDVRRLRNGNLVYLHGTQGAVEITMLGEVIHRWYATGLDQAIPDDAIPVPIATMHHELYELPSGNFLTLSTELRQLPDFPTSETDPAAARAMANVIGDVIVEFTRNGDVVQEWKLLDILDPYRIGYGSLSGFWDTRGYEEIAGGTRDWSHGNAVIYDDRDNSLIVSLRAQDAVVKIDRARGTVRWILGTPEGWRDSWRSYVLTPVGEKFEWPYHQHAPMLTPHGTVVLYDNGTYRARPFAPKLNPHDNYSRAVEYDIDESSMTVQQVWSYGGQGDERFYSTYVSNADWMPTTGNILVGDGGRIEDEEGRPSDNVQHGHRWARIVEVAHSEPARKLFEVVIRNEAPTGWSMYRAKRLPSL